MEEKWVYLEGSSKSDEDLESASSGQGNMKENHKVQDKMLQRSEN